MCLEMVAKMSCSITFMGIELKWVSLQFAGLLAPFEDRSDICFLPILSYHSESL